ncbi:TIGR01906 family membrane protein [Streptococcus sobrinus]|uniref:TIGR01906 family membrane protein n=1 Tax=Streptococcus sobrinus TaxID=1310 RepID=UPI0002EEB89E|nr:TIGR01906 family membrane protein [Streptococcus sobrinus]AWN19159.1 TIGR01906 family membrane protein [Streptococcus sobrinus]
MKEKVKLAGFALWLLSLAILLTIYLAWILYPLENHWLKLASLRGLTERQLLHNFSQLMNYLTLPWVTKLKMSDFPSSADGLAHFRDVKHLFHLDQAVFLLGLVPSWLYLKRQLRTKSLWLSSRLFVGLAVLPVLLGLLASLIGFDQFFTLFHHLLFPGATNWLFNPYTDPIIWVLPEDYFLHCFILFFLLYEIIMLGLFWLGKRSLKAYRNEHYRNN